ncbi:hypothetical protein HDU76_010772 [Blyttiomyces sp. JEL0837]|nr:hypothetical protein HDU76_010772 [Blyttiomyces sp. JEL0837]
MRGPNLFTLIATATYIVSVAAKNITLPISIPRNQYFVASNLITAIEYLHRAFPSNPSIYVRDGNYVFNYLDPVSGNVTDFVDVSDLYYNAKTLNDVIVGVETVMYNEVPSPDTTPLTLDVISNMKVATNYITNIASYDFSSTDQAYISSFYNFTTFRYKNLFARDNTTAVIPFKPLNLTNNPNATTAASPLYFNVTLFDAIDGNTYNNTLPAGTDPVALQTKLINILANTFQAYGLKTVILNNTNTTNTTTTSTSITTSILPTSVITGPSVSSYTSTTTKKSTSSTKKKTTTTSTSSSITSSSIISSYTSAEPSVTDTNDPGGFGRRGRRQLTFTSQTAINTNQQLHRRVNPVGEGEDIALQRMGDPAQGNNDGEPPTNADVQNSIGFFDKLGNLIGQGLTAFSNGAAGGAQAAQAALSLRANIASNFQKAADISKKAAKASGKVALNGVQTALKEGFIEASKGTAVGTSAKVGLIKAAGVVAADLVENLQDAAAPLVNDFLGEAEKTAMKTAMTDFFGFDEAVAADAVDIATSNTALAESTTLAKTMYAIGTAISKSPDGAYPDFDTGGIEDWVGRRMDHLLKSKYGPNVNKNSKFGGNDVSKYPRAEFDSLRTILDGVTDKVAAGVEFDEAKFLTELTGEGFQAEETFGYQVTAAHGVDQATSTLASLMTKDTIVDKTNSDFIIGEAAAVGADNFISQAKSTPQGKQALRTLGTSLNRAKTKDANGNLQMDANGQAIYNALGDKGFSGLTKNARAGLKSLASRAATTKNLINNKNRQIFRNLLPKH